MPVRPSCYYLELGDVAAADRETEIQEHFAANSRQAYHRWMAVMNRGARASFEGRFEDAEHLLKQAFEITSHIQVGGALEATQGFRNILLEQQGRAGELLPGLVSLATASPQIPLWRAAVAANRITLGQTEAARKDLESLAANDFRDIPRDLVWLYAMWRLAGVVSFFGDAPRAAMLYDLLLPYADRCAIPSLAACRGSVARPLGVLATVLARYDDAERHFEKALEMNMRIRARIWVAHTQHDYARMLVARSGPGDREKATALAAQALATAREVGMKPLEARLVELRTTAGLGEDVAPEPVAKGQPVPTAPAVFRQEGDFWTIGYDGKHFRLKDAKGLQYIAHLLRHEGREFHAAELAAGAGAGPPLEHEAEGDVASGLGDAGEMLDAQARSEYRQRLEDLRAELDEATRWEDQGRAARLREELEVLTEQLSAAYGVGGRVRKAGDVADRARKAVTSRIRETITRIAGEHAALGRHLENAIRTGVFCSYRPDRSPDWKL